MIWAEMNGEHILTGYEWEKAQFSQCPECGSQEVEIQKTVIENGKKTSTFWCWDCGYRWESDEKAEIDYSVEATRINRKQYLANDEIKFN